MIIFIFVLPNSIPNLKISGFNNEKLTKINNELSKHRCINYIFNFIQKCSVSARVFEMEIVIRLGDQITQISCDRNNEKHISGLHGSAKWVSSQHFCFDNGLCIGNNYLDHKGTYNRLEIDWYEISNEMYYFCTSRRWRAVVFRCQSFQNSQIRDKGKIKLDFKRIEKPMRPHNM